MRWLLVLGVFVLMSADSFGQNKPGIRSYDEQIDQMLRQQFDRIDKNKDGNIDPEEAAKHFRGPNAKPAPELMNRPTGAGNPFADKNILEPAKPENKPADKPGQLPAKPVAKPMDVQFFEAVDTNHDNLVSWDEFYTYFEKLYEVQLQEYQKLMQQMRQLQQQMARASGNQLQVYRRQMANLQQLQRRQLDQFRRQLANPQFRRLPLR
ncbi:MAG: EF-hand domain-containing protein [Gemmatales bacterium]|nr:EF-hand domain-containing protein [Gemmatales bacterium]MCS7160929.1 EF-hand domain-containing protein [Gemmatales bacterium]MDW8176131.1 EF-hand domain-containing protein [Gemmatales bacterium]MDW8222065.1 EF-hand domain-containing protein [Gemmatales bacterium]